MPTRFKITFQSLDYVKDVGDYKRFDYTICTCLDERKALVMATYIHMTKHPQSGIYRVIDIQKLDGTEPEKTDAIDRMEY